MCTVMFFFHFYIEKINKVTTKDCTGMLEETTWHVLMEVLLGGCYLI